MKSAGNDVKSVGLLPKIGSRGRYPLWVAAALFLVAVIVTPYIPLVVSLFRGGGESWDHVRTTVLSRYAVNTAFLVGGATLFASVIGVAGAWILERYRLPLPRVLELSFVAPLALPVYIGTFTWNGIFAYRGPLERLLGINVPFSGMWAAIFILVIGLYPYVYLTTRAALMANSRVLFEVVASLSGGMPQGDGLSRSRDSGTLGMPLSTGGLRFGGRRQYWRRLWTGVLPSLRPAIVGGASLVAMETMNAYATPVFLGVETLSTGVFRTWFGLGDLPTATLLAAIVLLAMLTLIGVEQYGRGRRRYTTSGGAPAQKVHLPRWGTTLLTMALLLPALLGFFIPMAQLVWWTVLAGGEGLAGIGVTAARTIALALATTLVILAVAVLLNLVAYLRPGWMMNSVLRIAGIGYAVPGTVVAIGVLAVFQRLRLIDERLFLFGTVGGLIFAYVARYLAVAVQPIQSGFVRQHRSTVDAARSLGSGPARVLTRVVLPVFRPTLAGAALLVAIDVIKDLPMTLLLRPFDFNTLAVQVYRLASDERMPEASPRALLLVAVGILTIWVIMSPAKRTAEDT
jgi:iron(III) transport system permease protein